MKGALWIVLLGGAATGACTLITSLDGLTGGGPQNPASEGGAEARDAIADAAEADAAGADAGADDAGQNLFPKGTFDPGDGNCVGNGYDSDLSLDTTAHGGDHACRVCSAAPPDGVYSYDQPVEAIGTPIPGTRYHAEVWVRAPTDKPAPSNGVEITLRTFKNQPSYTQFELTSSGYFLVGAAWTKLSVEFAITQASEGSEGVDVYVDAKLEDGTCFLMDDVVVRREL